MNDPRAFLRELRRDIESHPAVNHIFLNRLATAPFSREDYKVFGENHVPLVSVFTSHLERLLCRAPSSDAKLWLAKALVDAYGEDHLALYGRFLRSAQSRVLDMPSYRVPAPAHAFIEEHRRVVSKEPFLVGLGALGPGHAWAMPKMVAAILPGLRRAGFTEEATSYFTLHVEKASEKGARLEAALAEAASTDRAQQEIRRGALLSLDAHGELWSGVQRALVKYRQPRSARPDGKTPRTFTEEMLLTAWDGSKTAQRIEAAYAAVRERIRPTMTELLEQARR
jgi:pyrroloquinoline quinone (PQQ) biosynthesis protein C